MPQKRTKRRAERRSRPRADARLSMRVEGTPGGEAPRIVTESQNISSSGVYCTSSHYLAPLSKVALTIVLPRLPGGRSAKELIKCEGIVVRCQPSGRKSERTYELACMFSGLDERRRQLLDDFVAWRNLQALRDATRAVGDRKARRPRARAAGAATRARRKVAARRRTVH
jgi:hypothetical protein